MFQGKLELWIDMFQSEELPPKPAVDITPSVPVEYEIRVIVWNTEDVPLVESQFLTGEKCSDIFVKGYARGCRRRINVYLLNRPFRESFAERILEAYRESGIR